MMIGNLEPEENVMEEKVFQENSIQYPGAMLGQLALALEALGWDYGDDVAVEIAGTQVYEICLLYTSPSPRDKRQSRMPSSA